MTGTPFPDWMINLSNGVVVLGANLLVQSTIIISVGLAVSYFLRKKGAAVQSTVLRAFLATIFLCLPFNLIMQQAGVRGITFEIPLASLARTATSKSPPLPVALAVPPPAGEIQTAPSAKSSSAVQGHIPLSGVTDSKAVKPFSARRQGVPDMQRPGRAGFSKSGRVSVPRDRAAHAVGSVITVLFTALWAACSLFLLGRFLLHHFYISYIRRSAVEAKPSSLSTCLAVSQTLGVRMPRVIQSPLVQSPFITGIVRPCVFLPLGGIESLVEVKTIFLHELAHLARHDTFWNLARQTGIALFPFQPLLWVLSNRIEETSDYACDDYVTNATGKYRSYADSLIAIAGVCRPAPQEVTAGVGIISFKSPLRRRVERILDVSRTITMRVGARMQVLVYTLCFCIIFLAGLVGIKGKSFARTNSVSEILSKTGSVVKLALAAAVSPPNSGKYEAVGRSGAAAPKVEQNDEALLPGQNQMSTGENASGQDAPLLTENIPQPMPESQNVNVSEFKPAPSTIHSVETQPVPTKPGSEQTVPLSASDKPESKQIKPAPSLPPSSPGVQPMTGVKTDIAPTVQTGDLNIQPPTGEGVLASYLVQGKQSPVWSPDGKTIAFNGYAGWGIWSVSAAGGQPKLVYDNSGEWEYQGRKFGGGLMKTLGFTPDGQELTFVKFIFLPEKGSDVEFTGPSYTTYIVYKLIPIIASMNIRTGVVRELAWYGIDGSWTPDGRYFVYWAGENIEDQKLDSIIVYDTQTGERRILVEEGASPCVTPDGASVMYTDGRQLYRVALAGGKPERLPADGGLWNPKCSPDGRWVLCSGNSGDPADNHVRVRAYDLLTGKTRDILSFPDKSAEMGYWSPNGKQFCYSVTEYTESITQHSKAKGAFLRIANFQPEETVRPEIKSAPVQFALIGNHPNPFNPSTTIEFTIPAAGAVNLTIYNTAGQKVRELVSGSQAAGKHSAVWNGRDESGKPVSSGVYIAQLKMEGKVESRRMMLVK